MDVKARATLQTLIFVVEGSKLLEAPGSLTAHLGRKQPSFRTLLKPYTEEWRLNQQYPVKYRRLLANLIEPSLSHDL